MKVKAACANRSVLTEWWGVILGENLILGSVRVKEQKVIEIADAVGQRANGEVFGCVGHEVPNHSLTWRHAASCQNIIQLFSREFLVLLQ